MRHYAEFCADRSNRCGDTAVYNFSTRRLSAVSDLVQNFNCSCSSEGQNASSCQIVCKSVKALRRYGRFRFFKMAVVRHLGLSKVGNFNRPYPSEVQNASPCQILCRLIKPLRRYGHLKFFKMAAVRHLGFVIRLFGPPTKCILVVSVTVQNLV